jgi:hypothetical protein
MFIVETAQSVFPHSNPDVSRPVFKNMVDIVTWQRHRIVGMAVALDGVGFAVVQKQSVFASDPHFAVRIAENTVDSDILYTLIGNERNNLVVLVDYVDAPIGSKPHPVLLIFCNAEYIATGKQVGLINIRFNDV